MMKPYIFMEEIKPIVSEVHDPDLIFNEFYNQLPSDHWLKNSRNIYMRDMLKAQKRTEKFAILATGVTLKTLENSGKVGKAYSILGDDVSKEILKLFSLKTSDGKEINKIDLNINETLALNYYFQDSRLSFILDEKHIDLNNGFVLAYTGDPTIASIRDGDITGMSKGTTDLFIFRNGILLDFKVEVE
ncbi:hypothetical protein DSY4576 [Desulfitobacterium hafniense Y51]|uniref:Uncharacterized protein n=1 Tax=Desulfitobacterium hafniense (strain Y51) TaxID=138119 RepID=Q24NM7_DESHY|nr:hypothetical protein DSY4576 [Desulfitobacterium hafniense Y51]